MSRVGKKIIAIPDGVTVKEEDGMLDINGPLGAERYRLLDGIGIKIEDNILSVVIKNNNEKLAAFHGLSRALISNMITGVSKGFKKELEINGVGYKAVQQGQDVEFSLGYSHTILFNSPEGVAINAVEPTKIEVTGINKQKVGQVAANIRKLRPPEPYKGKGIRYKDEIVRKKAGKAGKI